MLYHATQITLRIIRDIFSKKVIFKVKHLFLSRACNTDIY